MLFSIKGLRLVNINCVMAFVHQFMSFFYLLHCCAIIVSFLIGSCGLLLTFIKDMENHLSVLNHRKKSNEQIETIVEFVDFHSTVKQFSEFSYNQNAPETRENKRGNSVSGMFDILWTILQSLSRRTMCGALPQFVVPYWLCKWNWFVH